jgi:hypothetical protein
VFDATRDHEQFVNCTGLPPVTIYQSGGGSSKLKRLFLSSDPQGSLDIDPEYKFDVKLRPA